MGQQTCREVIGSLHRATGREPLYTSLRAGKRHLVVWGVLDEMPISRDGFDGF